MFEKEAVCTIYHVSSCCTPSALFLIKIRFEMLFSDSRKARMKQSRAFQSASLLVFTCCKFVSLIVYSMNLFLSSKSAVHPQCSCEGLILTCSPPEEASSICLTEGCFWNISNITSNSEDRECLMLYRL